MEDIFNGIFAILFVITIFALRDSENKWIAMIGWGIVLLIKMFH